MADDLESFFKKVVYTPDKEDITSKLMSMYERGEFNPQWFAEIDYYIKNSKPGNKRLLERVWDMYESEEWDGESVREIKEYIINSSLKT